MTTHELQLRLRAEVFFQAFQDEVTSTLELTDGSALFRNELWERPGGGGGRTRIMIDGDVFEKAGVNFSAVYGDSPESLKHGEAESTFFATGTSLVLHPRSPMIPTVHANFRYFEQSSGQAWFGGGMDLTPHYLDEEDAVHFHTTIKHACDKHDISYYPRFKKWCDEYFYIKHRSECRGIGGIFFDQLGGTAQERERLFNFVKDAAGAFLTAYIPIVEKHKHESYTEAERRWQAIRHGRYVEFNLVYDRGTRFGLETSGRIESILMSLPATAAWEYDHQPERDSPEARLVEALQHPRDWIALGVGR